jgi:hypothetical protein
MILSIRHGGSSARTGAAVTYYNWRWNQLLDMKSTNILSSLVSGLKWRRIPRGQGANILDKMVITASAAINEIAMAYKEALADPALCSVRESGGGKVPAIVAVRPGGGLNNV